VLGSVARRSHGHAREECATERSERIGRGGPWLVRLRWDRRDSPETTSFSTAVLYYFAYFLKTNN
jgi:hypothetical protein